MAERPLLSRDLMTPSRIVVRRPRLSSSCCDTRCVCGSLLARIVGDQVELKCKRCKRITLVPLTLGDVEARRQNADT
jgi:phage FluMu protein Com